MLSSVLIIVLSLVLLVYWFRASCMLILRSKADAAETTTGTRFAFGAVQEQLKSGGDLDPLHRALQRDYDVFVYLVEHASGLSLESFEDRLLRLDYRVMRLCFWITRRLAPAQARRALSEMASIMAVLVGRVGEQTSRYAEA